LTVGDHYRNRGNADHDLRLAATYYRRACGSSDPAGCTALAVMAMRGEGVARDLGRAGALLQHACAAHYQPACTRLGEVRLLAGDDVGAEALWRAACDHGEARACVWLDGLRATPSDGCEMLSGACSGHEPLACALLAGRVLDAQCASAGVSAIESAAAACERDEPEGCYQLGRALARAGREVDPASREGLTRACEFGHARACELLASWLTEGIQGPQSLPLAREYDARGCDLGSAPACAALARSLIRVSRDREHSAQIVRGLERACSANVAGTCRQLGDLLLDGQSVARDLLGAEAAYTAACGRAEAAACEQLGDLLGYRAAQSDDPAAQKRDRLRAAEALASACTGGRAKACVQSGLLAMHGIGGSFPSAHAAMLLACERGVADGCLYAGRQLRFGNGVTADRERAMQLLSAACTSGALSACRELQTMAAP
jgi:hypothetical protein